MFLLKYIGALIRLLKGEGSKSKGRKRKNYS